MCVFFRIFVCDLKEGKTPIYKAQRYEEIWTYASKYLLFLLLIQIVFQKLLQWLQIISIQIPMLGVLVVAVCIFYQFLLGL